MCQMCGLYILGCYTIIDFALVASHDSHGRTKLWDLRSDVNERGLVELIKQVLQGIGIKLKMLKIDNDMESILEKIYKFCRLISIKRHNGCTIFEVDLPRVSKVKLWWRKLNLGGIFHQ